MDGGILWRNGCDGEVLRCGAGERHQQLHPNVRLYPLGNCRYISVNFIRVRPPGYFIHIFITTPVVSALKKLLYVELSRSPSGYLNRFWIQVAVSLMKPPQSGFGSETALAVRSRFRSEAFINV